MYSLTKALPAVFIAYTLDAGFAAASVAPWDDDMVALQTVISRSGTNSSQEDTTVKIWFESKFYGRGEHFEGRVHYVSDNGDAAEPGFEISRNTEHNGVQEARLLGWQALQQELDGLSQIMKTLPPVLTGEKEAPETKVHVSAVGHGSIHVFSELGYIIDSMLQETRPAAKIKELAEQYMESIGMPCDSTAPVGRFRPTGPEVKELYNCDVMGWVSLVTLQCQPPHAKSQPKIIIEPALQDIAPVQFIPWGKFAVWLKKHDSILPDTDKDKAADCIENLFPQPPELSKIKQKVKSTHKITLEFQLPTGDYHRQTFDELVEFVHKEALAAVI